MVIGGEKGAYRRSPAVVRKERPGSPWKGRAGPREASAPWECGPRFLGSAVFLLVAIAAKALLPFVGRNLLTLALLSASHRSPSGAGPRSAAHRTFEFVGRLEHGHELGGDHDLRSAARIARFARFALTPLARAAAADLAMLS